MIQPSPWAWGPAPVVADPRPQPWKIIQPSPELGATLAVAEDFSRSVIRPRVVQRRAPRVAAVAPIVEICPPARGNAPCSAPTPSLGPASNHGEIVLLASKCTRF